MSGDTWQRPAALPPVEHWRHDERIRCLECGRWLRHLGRHLPSHGMDAGEYRATWGMARGEPLACNDYRFRRGEIAKATGGPERLRAWLPLIGSTARDEAHETVRRDGLRPQGAARRAAAATAGHHAAREARDALMRDRVQALGHADPDRWVRDAYSSGESIHSLSGALGVGVGVIRRWLVSLDVTIRARGAQPARDGSAGSLGRFHDAQTGRAEPRGRG